MMNILIEWSFKVQRTFETGGRERLTPPPCSIAESGAPISESAQTGDFLRTLPNRSSALPEAVSGTYTIQGKKHR
jgi:hypothetical protein